MTTTETLDDWRWSQAAKVKHPNHGHYVHLDVVTAYRQLVNDDVRPNPLRAFPEAVQEAEKTIVYMMEEMPTAEYLARLPHVLSTLYERGMVAERRTAPAGFDFDAANGAQYDPFYAPDVEEPGDTEALDARNLFEVREKEFYAAGERLEEAAKACEAINARDTVHDTVSFADELANLVNRHSLENQSGTPDFILGAYLADCLRVFGHAVQHRDAFNQLPLPTPDFEAAAQQATHVNECTTPERQARFDDAVAEHYASRAKGHPLRRHLDSLRNRFSFD